MKPLILNVDDNAPARYAKTRTLRQSGFEVIEAGSGTEAVELVRSTRPALVLLDMKMPDMSGYEVCRIIKADPVTATVLVIQISATFAERSDRVRGLDSGADGYLTEPVEAAELTATIRAFLRLQQAEEALRESETKHRTLLESLADGVFVAQEGHFVFANDALARMLGYAPDELRGLPFDAVIAPEFLATWTDRIQLRLTEAPVPGSHEVRLLPKNSGAPLWVEVRTSRVPYNGRPAVLGIFRDVTERNRMERALRERTEALLLQDRYKDEFLAMLSHELRNPLAPLSNALTLLQSEASDATQTSLLSMAKRQVEHLLRLVSDLLDASRITRGTIHLERAPIDLAEAVRQSVETTAPLIEACRHRLEQSLMPEPLVVNGDLTRLAQVFTNLLNNAAKYTDPGGTIHLSAAREGDAAVVRVRDSGRGIHPDLLPKIFDLFVQADRAFDRAQSGLGIGLTLVQRLVHAHGGDVEAISKGLGEGSEFIVRLPLCHEAPLAYPAARRGPVRAGMPRRVLLVDDNPDVVASYAVLLSKLGHEVRTLSESGHVLDLVATFQPDIVLLDIGMPGIDGLELAKRLRQHHLDHRMRLVAVTGYGDQRTRDLIRAAGFDFHIVKPAAPEAIEDLVASLP